MIAEKKGHELKQKPKSRSRFRRFCRRALLFILLAAAVLTVLVVFVNARVAARGRTHLLTLEQAVVQPAYDCIIVPGALVYANGKPSAMLRDRLDMALQLCASGAADRILVSGDHGRVDYDEVGGMRQYLIDGGFPEDRIFMDHAGFDTYDTLYRAKSIFGVERALITTQDFHLLRAIYIGEELGLDLQGVDCGYVAATRRRWYDLREYPARFKAFLDCEIWHAAPTFGGETIPISGLLTSALKGG